MSNAPERIWINKVHGLHPEDWDFTDGAHLTKAQLRQKVEYVRADLATHAENLQQALELPAIAVLVDALCKSAEGWDNVIGMGLIAKKHFGSARVLRDEALDALQRVGVEL